MQLPYLPVDRRPKRELKSLGPCTVEGCPEPVISSVRDDDGLIPLCLKHQARLVFRPISGNHRYRPKRPLRELIRELSQELQERSRGK